MELTEQFILLQAPNAAAASNGRKLSQDGKFTNLRRTADGLLYWGECAGSGQTRYRVSVDWTDWSAPVCRCSCSSRQFPCKHALGLLYELLAQKPFQEVDVHIPQNITDKRTKQAQRAKKKVAAAASPAKPQKPNTAAQAKRVSKQLEGLDMAEKMVGDLLNNGIGSLGGTSSQTFDKLAKDLGNYYLTGPQTAFSRIALAIRTTQKDPGGAQSAYAEALRVLIALHSTIKKSRAFLQAKLDAGQFTAEDTVLFEALGGVWRLEDLHAIGAYREKARLVQLSFDVSFDEAKKEYSERGWWMDAAAGAIDYTLNLRPAKTMKHIQADDSRFELFEIPTLYTYPGEGSRRIRWEAASSRPLTRSEHAALPGLAQPDIAAAVKLAKGQFKNTLLPKFAPMLLPVGRVGTVGDAFVLEDPAGGRIVLRDRPEDGADHASTARLTILPEKIPAGSALFGLLFYDETDRTICLHPYSVVTPEHIIRLQY